MFDRDSVHRVVQKVLAARDENQQQPEQPPPPYEEDDNSDDEEAEDEDADEADDSSTSSQPMKLTVNATNSIQGSNNLVPINPAPLSDATKFSAILMHAINQINNATNPPSTSPRRPRKFVVELTVNCGITIVGDKNVIGNVAVKPKVPAAEAGTNTTVATADVATAAAPSTANNATTTTVSGAAATIATGHALTGAKRKADSTLPGSEVVKRPTTTGANA